MRVPSGQKLQLHPAHPNTIEGTHGFVVVLLHETPDLALSPHIMLNDSKDSAVVLSGFVDAISETDHKVLEELDRLITAKKRALRRRLE